MGCLLPRATATNMAEIQEVEEVPRILLPCAVCGRTFRPEALEKHSAVCERQHSKKRKKFDSSKQRIQGTELAEFLGPPPVASKPRPKPPSPKKAQSRWKEKHEALVRTIRDEPCKPIDHQQCLYCDRFFGPKAFDRHVAWCKDQHSKIQVQSEDVNKAKKRLQARTKYRAPSFRSQRAVTKEKYSPQRPLGGSILSTSTSAPSPVNTRVTASPVDPPRNVFSTETAVNSDCAGGLGRRNLAPLAKRPTTLPMQKSVNKSNELNSKEESSKLTRTTRADSISSQGSNDFTRSISSTVCGLSAGAGDNMSTSLNFDSKPNIKQSLSTNRNLDSYDPFVSAEIQMMELLKAEEENKHSQKHSSTGDNTTHKNDDEETPPVSDKSAQKSCEKESRTTSERRASSGSDKPAQSSVSRRASVDSVKKPISRSSSKNSSEPKDSDKTVVGRGTSSPSSPFRSSPSSAFTPVQTNNNVDEIVDVNSNNQPCKMLSLSTLSLCSEASLDALDSGLKQRCMSAAAAAQPQRITTSRLSKQRLNMHDLLFGLDPKSNDSLNNNNKISSRQKEMDRCEAQLLSSMVEFELLLNSSPDSPSPTHAPNQTSDSAYSSLNRRWSPNGDQNPAGGLSGEDAAISKFCHECGGRYPVPGAKFCCLCGVKRLAI